MSAWQWLELLVVWIGISVVVCIPVCRIMATRRELDTVDFDDWLRRAQWAEPVKLPGEDKEDHHVPLL